jgi:hypothetical protein
LRAAPVALPKKTMGRLLQHRSNAAKALELKMWVNGTQYIIYLGGLPLNIKSGYATYADGCEEEYIAENNVAQTELCSNHREAMQLFEHLNVRYME